MKKNKISVFVINSLQNGGAERVVINQSSELIKKGHKVVFILFRDRIEYDLDEKIKIIKLTRKNSFSKFEKIFLLPKLILKLNKVYKKLEKKYEIELLTSHLPLPHFICRFSNIRNKTVYVLHNPHYQFKFSKKMWFKKMLQFMYNNKKLVSVSNGVKNELLNDFNVKTKYIETIYNPISIKEIESKLNEKNIVDMDEQYILFCGRLSKEKRPDRMLDAFYYGEFYKKYKLVYIGIGDYEEKLKEKITEYNINDSVILKGWQKNAFQWMKKSKLLVCTSDFESFGMVLAEALCCETPVVSVDCNFGPNEILVDDLSKFLCVQDNIDIIDKMKLALKKYPKDLKKYIKKFDVENNIKYYLDFYDKCK